MNGTGCCTSQSSLCCYDRLRLSPSLGILGCARTPHQCRYSQRASVYSKCGSTLRVVGCFQVAVRSGSSVLQWVIKHMTARGKLFMATKTLTLTLTLTRGHSGLADCKDGGPKDSYPSSLKCFPKRLCRSTNPRALRLGNKFAIERALKQVL